MPTKGTVVVAGAAYGSNAEFLTALRARGLAFVVEVRASELVARTAGGGKAAPSHVDAARHLRGVKWQRVCVPSPVSKGGLEFTAARVPGVTPHLSVAGQLVGARSGGVGDLRRGISLAYTSEERSHVEAVVAAAGWVRWIRTVLRRRGRSATARTTARTQRRHGRKQARVVVRANITLAERQDERGAEADRDGLNLRGVLTNARRRLTVVELFAGAGGMGLGFVMASRAQATYQLVFSGEVNPIYVETLRHNHRGFSGISGGESVVPESVEPTDLRKRGAHERAASAARSVDGVDVLIGGPPCQGFSNANRNSWSSSNPNNRLVDVFMSYVEELLPRVFVMENVQGILWTPRRGQPHASFSVVDYHARRMERAGYLVFPKLLDAVWFGVPQYRSRFFLVGIHLDLGYERDDFGAWGPFPRPTHGPGTGTPYVTVRDAIRDLPRLENGETRETVAYADPSAAELASNGYLRFMRAGAEKAVVSDHVTSRHADYVIERYRRIPPGGNWEDILDTMSNYADVERTHSNIYRRLTWSRPSITIGHYRKSMLVHPSQARGLSLREASRLQSFPDWFRFAGRTDGMSGGLVHKQQQLANAVCPLVTRALAEFLLSI